MGSCASTSALRESARPPYNVNLNNSGILRAVFNETDFPLESGDSGSEKSANPEQVGAQSLSVVAAQTKLPPTTIPQSFPAFPTISPVDESDEVDVDNPDKVRDSRSET